MRVRHLQAAVVCCAAVQAGAAVKVDCAYYHVDVGNRYPWSEGAAGITDFAKTDRRAGTLRVYVRNDGDTPAKIEATALNGTDLEELRTNERHEVIWWRTWPDPVPAGGHAEISVRLRYPPTADMQLTLGSAGGTQQATVPLVPPGFRIETVAWADGGRRLTIVAEKLRDDPVRVQAVFVDGVDVTAGARMPAPSFAHGICPIEIDLDEPQAQGSFHTCKLVAANGDAVACTLRTLDEFLRLGMYGAGDLERDVKLGINCAGHFRPLGRGALDRYAAFGVRSAFHVGPSGPASEVRGHPAVHGYIMHDEPDCWDYAAKEWPAPMRIGFHGPDIVRHVQQCAAADPAKPVLVTVDLTFKPANYYVYSQIPDIIAPDCYPLTIGQPLTWVREVTETCRKAAGPRRVETIPQVDYEDRQKAEMKYRRAPFAAEVVIQYLYALGAGARGFSGWEWFDEKADWCHFYGAPNFPDVLNTVGDVFRRFELLAPLILKAHPTEIASCSAEDVWVKTLVCGTDALLLVVVNDDYESLPNDFVHRPKQDVAVTVPALPWLRPQAVAQVEDGRLTALPVTSEGRGRRVVLPQLDVGTILLVTESETAARELVARYERGQAAKGRALLRGNRIDAGKNGREAGLERVLTGRFADRAVSASKLLSGYGTDKVSFWNPSGSRHPGIEWWTENTPRGGEWRVAVSAEDAGKEHSVWFQMASWWGGGHLRVEIDKADGTSVLAADKPVWDGPIPNLSVTFPTPGEYVIRILQAGPKKPGGRLSRDIFVVPHPAAALRPAAW